MGLETETAVRRRATIHAALADPARLAIVDTLGFGDASPSELQHALRVSSNLLAHHLKVLEGAGLITRTRSEADRRRSYWRLIPGTLDRLAGSRTRHVHRVLFVCKGASARSQLAATLWRRASAIPACAAGTHPAAHISTGAIDSARRHGLPLRQVRPRHLDEVRDERDFVVTVCDRAHEALGRLPDVHWSVPDPVPVGTRAAFDAAYDELSRRVTDLAPRLAAK